MKHRTSIHFARRAFTLTELMVAVSVLIVIILASSTIFNTTTTVIGKGEAMASVIQEIAAIESRLRTDLSNISREAVLGIRCTSVANDLYGGILLNQSLPPEARIRADQLVFFRTGRQGTHVYRVGQNANNKGMGSLSRIYFGHGVQFGDQMQSIQGSASVPLAVDPSPQVLLYPWMFGPVSLAQTNYGTSNTFDTSGSGSIQLPVRDARQWLLLRQPVMMVDDGGSSSVYASGQVLTTPSFFFSPGSGLPHVRDSRVDATSLEINDLRKYIQYDNPTNNSIRNWEDQYAIITNELLYYPRAERIAPSMHRVDQALTTPVLGAACSQIRIEWTYRAGRGSTNYTPGLQVYSPFQPWFGIDINGAYGDVAPYGSETAWNVAASIFPENVETFGSSGQVAQYSAAFGFNQTMPYDVAGNLSAQAGYTPWPDALRISLTLHDPDTDLESGIDVQFVIDLPREGFRP